MPPPESTERLPEPWEAGKWPGPKAKVVPMAQARLRFSWTRSETGWMARACREVIPVNPIAGGDPVTISDHAEVGLGQIGNRRVAMTAGRKRLGPARLRRGARRNLSRLRAVLGRHRSCKARPPGGDSGRAVPGTYRLSNEGVCIRVTPFTAAIKMCRFFGCLRYLHRG